MYILSNVVEVPGPPSVSAKIRSKVLKLLMVSMINTKKWLGVSMGKVMELTPLARAVNACGFVQTGRDILQCCKIDEHKIAHDYLEHNRQNMLEKAFLSLMQSQPGYASENAVELLAENGALKNYAIAYLVMDFSAVSGWKDFSSEERAKTFEWVRELCREVAQTSALCCRMWQTTSASHRGIFQRCSKSSTTRRWWSSSMSRNAAVPAN